MKTLLDIFNEASDMVSMYRQPDLEEFKEAANKILSSANLGGLCGGDKVTSVDVGEETVCIEYEYSVRCCDQNDSYEFPTSILEAENPELAAKLWALNTAYSEARNKMNEASKELDRQKEKVELLYKQIIEVQEG